MTTKRQQHLLNAVEAYVRAMQNHFRLHMSAVMEAERAYRESRSTADMGLDLKTGREKEALLKAFQDAQDTSDEEI
jgi:hypothetical protein